jgi:uncharacterized membrane protein
MCAGAFLLALLASYLDKLYAGSLGDHWPNWLIYQGHTDGAYTILSTVAGSMITVAGVTFSVTMVALSLASSQFGPRLLVNFMRDTGNQFVLGTFVSAFLYCLLALGNVHGEQSIPPAVSTTIGVVMASAGIWVFIYFMHHVSSTIRAEHVVDVVAQDVAEALVKFSERHRASDFSDNEQINWSDENVDFVRSPCSGYLQAIDENKLLELAESWDTVIKLTHRPGQFVNCGEILLRIEASEKSSSVAEQFNDYFIIGRSRTDEQDPEYGIFQLVEIAVRALSPGVNDPNTAVACLDWLGSALCLISDKPLPEPYRTDGNGALRLICNPITFEGLVRSAFEQIRQNAYAIPAVSIRMMEVFQSISDSVSNAERQKVLLNQADLLLQGSLETNMQSLDERDLKLRYEKVKSSLQS